MEQFVQQLVNGLMLGSTYAVVALGFGLVFSVMRVVNLAHPEIFMVGAYVAFVVLTVVLGLLLERLVVRPTRGTYLLIPFIATAGVSIVLQNGAQRLFGPDPVLVPGIIPAHTFNIGGVRVTNMQVTTLLTAVAIMIALRYYVHHTKW